MSADAVNSASSAGAACARLPADAALVEFVFAQGGRVDLPAPNPELVARGHDIFETGELSDGELTMSCINCHTMHPAGEDKPLSGDGTAPNLTGYGGARWLKRFIADPGASEFYGDKNAMPAFGGKLAEGDLDLLVRWLSGAYVQPAAERGEAE